MTSRGSGFPVMDALSTKGYLVGEIPFSAESIPAGSYTGPAGEIVKMAGDCKVQLVYLPGISEDLLVHLPPLSLPSGYNATLFPAAVCGNDRMSVSKTPTNREHVYPFGDGDFRGRWGIEEKEREHYVANLREFLESGKTTHGIDAIHLGKISEKRPSNAQVERAARLLQKYGFGNASFSVASYYSGLEGRLRTGEWAIARALNSASGDSPYSMDVSSTNRHDSMHNQVSIMLYANMGSMLSSGGMQFLDEFSRIF